MMVRNIKRVELCARENRLSRQKCLVASCHIEPGVAFNESNICAKRTGGVGIPANYVQLKHVHIAGTPTQPLEPKESPWLFNEFPTRSSESKPRFVAEDGANFVFGPYPDSNYVLGGTYWKKPTALSDSNTTNEWTDNCSDALLWACLCESAPFLMNDERILVWEGKYEQAKSRINSAEKKRARKGTRIGTG